MFNENYSHILVAVDISANSVNIINKASEIAIANNATLDILYVIDINSMSGLASISISNDIVHRLVIKSTEELNKYKSIAKNKGVKHTDIHIRFGIPKSVIAHDFSEDYPIDLLILGKSDLNPFARIFVGSVTSYVTNHVSKDILIIK